MDERMLETLFVSHWQRGKRVAQMVGCTSVALLLQPPVLPSSYKQLNKLKCSFDIACLSGSLKL